MWQIIKNACETDGFSAEQLLLNAQMACLDSTMQMIVDLNTGNTFKIPNFCINDPLYKREFVNVEVKEEKLLNVYYIIHIFSLL